MGTTYFNPHLGRIAMNSLKIACVQMDCIAGKIAENLAKAGRLLEMAWEKGADLVVLPELFNVGYNLELLQDLNYDQQESINALTELAKKLSLWIVAGILEVDNNGRYNTAIVVNGQGELVTKYRKIHLFPLSEEYKFFQRGTEIITFSLNHFRFGLMICFDIRFPELSRRLMELNCSALIISSAFLFPRLEHWRVLLKARAIENQLYVLAANRIGREEMNWFLGNSCIIDPWGETLATLDEIEEGIIVSEISLDKVAFVKQLMPLNQMIE
jgi:omega-amidase